MFFQIFAYLTEAVIVYMYIRHIYEPKKNKLISFITILVSYLMLFFIYRFRSVYKELHADHETGAADNK